MVELPEVVVQEEVAAADGATEGAQLEDLGAKVVLVVTRAETWVMEELRERNWVSRRPQHNSDRPGSTSAQSCCR